MDKISIGQNPELEKIQNGQTSNGQIPNCTKSRMEKSMMDKIQKRTNFEDVESQD